MAMVPNGVETLPKILIAWVGCTNVTDDRRQTTDRRQTDLRRHIANMNMSSRSLKTNRQTCNTPQIQQNFWSNSHIGLLDIETIASWWSPCASRAVHAVSISRMWVKVQYLRECRPVTLRIVYQPYIRLF